MSWDNITAQKCVLLMWDVKEIGFTVVHGYFCSVRKSGIRSFPSKFISPSYH